MVNQFVKRESVQRFRRADFRMVHGLQQNMIVHHGAARVGQVFLRMHDHVQRNLWMGGYLRGRETYARLAERAQPKIPHPGRHRRN